MCIKDIRKFFGSLQGWCGGDKVSSIRARLGISKKAWRAHKNVIQGVVDRSVELLEKAPDGRLGGRGVVVEVDECHLHTRKYHRGAQLVTESIWVVGILERYSTGNRGRRAAFFVTQKRGANELVPFIRKWVEPGSRLISDEWRGYTQELAQHYYRATVNHSVEFGYTAIVDGVEISINTNHIEREWREVRKAVEFLPASRYQEKLNREVFLLLFFAGHLKEELPFIFLENMAASMNY